MRKALFDGNSFCLFLPGCCQAAMFSSEKNSQSSCRWGVTINTICCKWGYSLSNERDQALSQPPIFCAEVRTRTSACNRASDQKQSGKVKNLSYSPSGEILPIPANTRILLLYAEKGWVLLLTPPSPAPSCPWGGGSSITKRWQPLTAARSWEPPQKVNRIGRRGLHTSWEVI